MKFAIIDGTGPWRDKTYEREMHFSYCSQIGQTLHAHIPPSPITSEAQYERGPSFEGFRMHERGQHAADFLKAGYAKDKAQPLYLAGYSRGASAAIMAAEILEKDKIPVTAMFLFDPVARHMSSGGEVIPANVEQVWVARRDRDPALARKYEAAGAFSAYLPVGNPMRPWFGETALNHRGRVKIHDRTFKGSHGALGGVGWAKTWDLDGPCQRDVAEWMNKAFFDLKIGVTLKSYKPAG